MEQPDKSFIKMLDGQPVGNPFFLSNLLMCGIDPRGTAGWAEFIPQPYISPSRVTKVTEEQYVVDGEYVRGTWIERDMAPDEIAGLPEDHILRMKGSPPDAID